MGSPAARRESISMVLKKRMIGTQTDGGVPNDQWLDIETLAEVEMTSEQLDYPVEAALLPGHATGWRAMEPGKQTIRLCFARPQHLRRIWLSFVETGVERSQEYVL